MSFESALSFFIAVLIFGMTPGPGVFAILSKAMVHGARSCLFLAFGMTISDILYLIAACFGLATIATHYSSVFSVIRIAGALYLFYLGWKMWTAPVSIEAVEQTQTKKNHTMSFIQGFLISASNPKVILFYIAFLPTFMDLTVLTGQDIMLVSVLTLVALMIGLMCIAGFASKARLLFQSEKATLRLNRSAGSIMIGAGAFLLARS
ncbi:LysE family translocator [Reinekea sp.]|jgi:threonine/homoserine/homoserine lactone efflux protein|uniref:LysE family translocator n=1 Tax=Reinekea sp. TaxID=1970455 RepID=UPI003988A9E2